MATATLSPLLAFIPGISHPAFTPGSRKSPAVYLVKQLGEGAYGRVYEAKFGRDSVALKVNMIADNVLGVRSLRELDILKKCQAHPHIVRFCAIFFDKPFLEDIIPKPGQTLDPLYMVMEYADLGNLEKYAGSRYTATFTHPPRTIYNQFSTNELVDMTYQMLTALEFTHGLGVIHRDLKLSNFVVSRNPDGPLPIIRLVDFGTSRESTCQGCMSPTVTTYPYRAPEVCIQLEQYGKAVDSWSMGCIFYELVTGERFINVTTDADSLILSEIYRIHPEPMSIERLRQLAQQPNSFATSCFNNRPRRTWGELLKCCDIGYSEMIQGLMKMDPAERWTIKQALECPYWGEWQQRLNRLRTEYPVGRPKFIYEVSRDNYDYCQRLLNSFADIIQSVYHKKWFSMASVFICVNLIYRVTANLIGVQPLIPKARLHTYILMYMVVKYQICISDPPPWHEVAPSIYHQEETRAEVIRVERKFLEAVHLQVYSTTPYDVCERKLTQEENNKLLDFMTSKPDRLNGLTPEQVVVQALGIKAPGA